jgi:hypothetical protein
MELVSEVLSPDDQVPDPAVDSPIDIDGLDAGPEDTPPPEDAE